MSGEQIWSDAHARRRAGEERLAGPCIEGRPLTVDDVGRRVTYVPSHAKDDPSKWERGTLSSFRFDGAIFVRFKGPNGERCDPSDLRWG